MQTEQIGCKQKDRMQTKKIGCKQETKTCHDASSSLGQLTPSLSTSYKLQIMILMDWSLAIGPNWPRLHEIKAASYLLWPFRHYSIFFLVCRSFFVCILSFLFASDHFCLHRDRFWFFVCIRSFLFASDLFCLHPIFFVCILSFLFASYLFVCILSLLFAANHFLLHWPLWATVRNKQISFAF